MMVAVHRTECTIAARSRYRYTVKQYFHKMEKNCILKDIYLPHPLPPALSCCLLYRCPQTSSPGHACQPLPPGHTHRPAASSGFIRYLPPPGCARLRLPHPGVPASRCRPIVPGHAHPSLGHAWPAPPTRRPPHLATPLCSCPSTSGSPPSVAGLIAGRVPPSTAVCPTQLSPTTLTAVEVKF
jgi:hypothetical protein